MCLQIGFEALRGNDIRSDIAVDTITITSGSCDTPTSTGIDTLNVISYNIKCTISATTEIVPQSRDI